MGSRGVVPSAGLEVRVTGLTVTRRVSFPPTGVLQNRKMSERPRLLQCLQQRPGPYVWNAAILLMGYWIRRIFIQLLFHSSSSLSHFLDLEILYASLSSCKNENTLLVVFPNSGMWSLWSFFFIPEVVFDKLLVPLSTIIVLHQCAFSIWNMSIQATLEQRIHIRITRRIRHCLHRGINRVGLCVRLKKRCIIFPVIYWDQHDRWH